MFKRKTIAEKLMEKAVETRDYEVAELMKRIKDEMSEREQKSFLRGYKVGAGVALGSVVAVNAVKRMMDR